MKNAVVVLFGLVLGACAHGIVMDPAIRNDWNRTLYNARLDADTGNYFAADKLFDEFVRIHPGTPEAREMAFWKAAYMVDPANPLGSLSGGVAALDSYLASTNATGRYANEAVLLRRTAAAAAALESMSSTTAQSAVASPTDTVKDTVVVVRKSRDEEIASLRDQLAKSKDELAKVSAELDRIKKRLANPDK
jgi:hypothetical protein